MKRVHKNKRNMENDVRAHEKDRIKEVNMSFFPRRLSIRQMFEDINSRLEKFSKFENENKLTDNNSCSEMYSIAS